MHHFCPALPPDPDFFWDAGLFFPWALASTAQPPMQCPALPQLRYIMALRMRLYCYGWHDRATASNLSRLIPRQSVQVKLSTNCMFGRWISRSFKGICLTSLYSSVRLSRKMSVKRPSVIGSSISVSRLRSHVSSFMSLSGSCSGVMLVVASASCVTRIFLLVMF